MISPYIYRKHHDLHLLGQLLHLHLLSYPLLQPCQLLAIQKLAVCDVDDEEDAGEVSELLLGQETMELLPWPVEGGVKLGAQECLGRGAEDKDQRREPDGAIEGRQEHGRLCEEG